MYEYEYIKVIDRVPIATESEQLEKVRPTRSIGGISEAHLEKMIIRLK